MTDAGGRYAVQGVPEGRVNATASLAQGFLTGTASATLEGDGTSLTLDVALRDSGSVSGRVFEADGVTAAAVSIVSIQVGGVGGNSQTVTTNAAGAFQFDRVAAGLATVRVDELGSIDAAEVTVDVPAGGAAQVDVSLNGIGSIAGRALDSTSEPTSGMVTVSRSGPFAFRHQLAVGASGEFSVPEVLAGPFTVSLQVGSGALALYGNASATLTPGGVAQVDVRVEDSATITGDVRRAGSRRGMRLRLRRRSS